MNHKHVFRITTTELVHELNALLKEVKQASQQRPDITLTHEDLSFKLYGLTYTPRHFTQSALDDDLVCFEVQQSRTRTIHTFDILEQHEDGETTSFARSYLLTLRMFCQEHATNQ